MQQAKHHICTECMTGVPRGHKFCGRCGAGLPDAVMSGETQFFSDLQNPEKARLILVYGDEMEGLSYHLKAEQHLLGRTGQLEFPDDSFLSPTHANFLYRNKRLVVRDEGSLNGVFLRIKGKADIHPGDLFMAGSQVFRLDLAPKPPGDADADGTYFYASPRQSSSFRVTQILAGGTAGMTVCSLDNTLRIGREACDLNFPNDPQMSLSHCAVEEANGKFVLLDNDSKNGTFLRIKGETALTHGDYIFVGHKLLRVEMTA
jgi:pSer/pThr/pTyr-binding forkhead associated (FHA) protein